MINQRMIRRKCMLGIIGAMDEEVAILKESMEVQDTMERAGMTFVKGIMSGKEVVVVRSGIGKVNMGICAQILIDCFGVDTLINTGIAGSYCSSNRAQSADCSRNRATPSW